MNLRVIISRDDIMQNTYVITEDQFALVIDPGKTQNLDQNELLDYLKKHEIKEVSIFLTHAHFDHIGSLVDLVNLYDAKIYLNQAEMVIFEHEIKRFASEQELSKITNNIIYVKDNINWHNHDFKVIQVPGHTIGHLMLEVDPLHAYFSGDFLFRDDIGFTHFYTGDAKMMKDSLAKLASLNHDYKVYPGHGMGTSIKHELENNHYINNPIEKW